MISSGLSPVSSAKRELTPVFTAVRAPAGDVNNQQATVTAPRPVRMWVFALYDSRDSYNAKCAKTCTKRSSYLPDSPRSSSRLDLVDDILPYNACNCEKPNTHTSCTETGLAHNDFSCLSSEL